MLRKKKPKVFVSYSRHDEALVKPLAGLLGAAADDAVFLDVSSIKPGDLWKDEIDGALRDASVFILCWCCQSERSQFIGYEIETALENARRRLIPVLFCSTPLPASLRSRQWIDLRGRVVHTCEHIGPVAPVESPAELATGFCPQHAPENTAPLQASRGPARLLYWRFFWPLVSFIFGVLILTAFIFELRRPAYSPTPTAGHVVMGSTGASHSVFPEDPSTNRSSPTVKGAFGRDGLSVIFSPDGKGVITSSPVESEPDTWGPLIGQNDTNLPSGFGPLLELQAAYVQDANKNTWWDDRSIFTFPAGESTQDKPALRSADPSGVSINDPWYIGDSIEALFILTAVMMALLFKTIKLFELIPTNGTVRLVTTYFENLHSQRSGL